MRHIVSDRPIETPDEDLLGRKSFARGIADQITHAPPNGTLRIGVYGDWGVGKTSVLRLIASELEDQGHICIWITPWVFSSKEEVIDFLIRSVANRLKIDISKYESSVRDAELSREIRNLGNANITFKLADMVFGHRIDKFYSSKPSENATSILEDIDLKLEERKLIVLIDDLDRVRPQLLPELLLTLREALDHSNYFYIMALAPKIIEQGLTSIHEGWDEPRQFIEKIIEFPKYVPEPSPVDRQRYSQALIESLQSQMNLNAVNDVAPLLPSNPRKIKLFIRYMDSLHGLFARFHEDEIDWSTLYLCLLMNFEFPEESRKLSRDEKALKDIETHHIGEHFRSSRKRASKEENEDKSQPEGEYAPKSRNGSKRFLDLCQALRNRDYFYKGKYRLHQIFSLLDEPPMLTYGEIYSLLNNSTFGIRIH